MWTDPRFYFFTVWALAVAVTIIWGLEVWKVVPFLYRLPKKLHRSIRNRF